MGSENDNNSETVVNAGQSLTVTSSIVDQNIEHWQNSNTSDTDAHTSEGGHDQSAEVDTAENAETENSADRAESSASAADPPEESEISGSLVIEQETDEYESDALRALTKLLVGGAIEGTSQLTKRLRQYEEELRQQAAGLAAEGIEAEELDEDEMLRLRYALVGLIFDAQSIFRKNLILWAKIADTSARATNRVAQPVTNSFLFSPIRRRYTGLVRRGEEKVARWIADGRIEEKPSRDLARMTYTEIVDEFINMLAENPELQAVITRQSVSVASDMRDNVREHTVTADNLVEGLVRRVLRRRPRSELPEPPPEVQRWSTLTLEEYRAEQLQADEISDEDA